MPAQRVVLLGYDVYDFPKDVGQLPIIPYSSEKLKDIGLKYFPVLTAYHPSSGRFIIHHVLEHNEGRLADGDIDGSIISNDHQLGGKPLGASSPFQINLGGSLKVRLQGILEQGHYFGRHESLTLILNNI